MSDLVTNNNESKQTQRGKKKKEEDKGGISVLKTLTEPSSVQETEPSSVQETEPPSVQETESPSVQETEPPSVQETEPHVEHQLGTSVEKIDEDDDEDEDGLQGLNYVQIQNKHKYPKIIFIANKSPSVYVIPQLNLQLNAGEVEASASVSKDALIQILNNAETFNNLNGWDGINAGIVIEISEKD